MSRLRRAAPALALMLAACAGPSRGAQGPTAAPLPSASSATRAGSASSAAPAPGPSSAASFVATGVASSAASSAPAVGPSARVVVKDQGIGGDPAPGSWPPGGVHPVVLRRVVRGAFPAMQACYEAGLARDPTLRGRVTVRVEIGPDGRVEGAEIAENGTSIDDRAMRRCVLEAYRPLTFPQPSGGRIYWANPLDFTIE